MVTTVRKNHCGQHRITANSGQFAEKCYFRDQVKNNKADKNVSLLHATCVKQDRCKQGLQKNKEPNFGLI